MAELFNITHEAGNLSEYDSTVEDSGDLSAHADAALAGTDYGLRCIIDDTTSIFGTKNLSAPVSGEIRFRFYLDPNTIAIDEGKSFYVCILGLSGAPSFLANVYLKMSSGNYRAQIEFYDDGGWLGSDSVAITDAPHYIEVYAVQGAGSGSYQWWVDGASQGTVSSVDNQDAFDLISYMSLGAVSGIDANTAGTLYLDELKTNDDGSEIGPVVASSSIVVLRRRIAA